MKTFVRRAITNLAVLIGVLVAVEVGSWAAINGYQWLRSGSQDASGVQHIAEAKGSTDPNDLTAKYSSPDVPAAIAAHEDMPGSAYRYESYLIYRLRPYASDLVNVDASGIRLNGRKIEAKSDSRPIRVWLLGSSPVFGATNADNETIPAALEKSLSEKFPDRAVDVLNLGVVGYTSWQEMLNFSMRLTELPKPDLAIFFTGHNDFQLAWLNQTEACEQLMHTAVGSDIALRTAWEARAAQQLVNWPVVRSKIEGLFSNTVRLGGLVRKYFALKSANRDIAGWKADYRSRRDVANKTADTCVARVQDTMLSNLAMATQLASRKGIKVAFVPQPLLYAAKKKLVGTEAIEAEHVNYNTFALNDAELEALREVPSYRIDQAYLWDKARYLEAYAKQGRMLGELAQKTGALFVDLDPAIEASGPVAIFASPIHFTFRGTALIGAVLADRIGPEIGTPNKN